MIIYRADGKPFTNGAGAYRRNVYRAPGWVTAMACWRDGTAGKTYVYNAQRGKQVGLDKRFIESDTEFEDKVVVLDGDSGETLRAISFARPRGLAVRGDVLYVLHADGDGFAVSRTAIEKGLPSEKATKLFTVPATMKPAGIAVDTQNRIYISDPPTNQVYRFDQSGAVTARIGKEGGQTPNAYDPNAMMSPGKLAVWTDREGKDRLLVVEQAGPNRLSEWTDHLSHSI